MPDDSRDDAESSPIAGWKRRNGAIRIGSVLVVTLLVGFVVWSNAFRSEPPTWEAISRAQIRGDFEEAVELCIQLAEADQNQATAACGIAGVAPSGRSAGLLGSSLQCCRFGILG